MSILVDVYFYRSMFSTVRYDIRRCDVTPLPTTEKTPKGRPMKMLHSIFSFMSILACSNGLGGFLMFLSFVYVLGTTHLKECLVVAGTTAHMLLALLVG